MENRKKTFGRKALSFVLATCMLVTTFAPTMATVAYAEDAGTSLVASSVSTVDEGNAIEVNSTETPTQPEADSSAGDESETSSSSQVPDSSNTTTDSSSSSSSDASSSSTSDASSSSSSETSDVSSSESQSQDTDSSVPTDPDSSSDSSSESTEGEDASSSDSTSEPEEGEESEDEDTEENPAEEFVALTILDPETGATIVAEVGDEVTLSAGLNRDDVIVGYQWQRLQLPVPENEAEPVEPVFDYPEGAPTWYAFPLTDVTEAEALRRNPDTKWNGIEMYLAAVDALDAIGADNSNVSFAWKTPNYALDGYVITAENADGVVKLYAEKDDQRYVATLNAEGKFEFSETAEAIPETVVENTWVDVEGATEPSYTFTVAEEDHYAQYRLKVTILDEEYLAKCIEILEGQGVELTDEQKAEQQNIYSVVMQVESAVQEEEFTPADTSEGAMAMASFFAVDSKPYLSEDGQWICGLNGNYEYITEDTYNRVTQWKNEGKITPTQYSYYWTWLNPKGWKGYTYANVLDENGFPTGATRVYNGFDLVDGDKLEVASEWYGKTVCFRVVGTNNITKIKIPAYTELSGSGDKYEEAASGTKYKKAITLLNPFPADTPAMYENFISYVAINGWLKELGGDGNFTGNLTNNHINVYSLNVESFNADPQRYMVDAEGNYRVDSVAWGVCTGQEPDISGKAYWVLKDFINEGYGFLTGHDTMYAYPGAYYDALGVDMDESSIDPNDGTTWYYDINSWMPGTTATDPNGNKSTTRGGHFYMNELMGTNAGNVYSETVVPSDAPSLILSTGGSHGQYGKMAMYGSELLNVVQTGYSAELAQQNPRYRTPTNYPYAFSLGTTLCGLPLTVPFTHTNGQAAFGNIWVDYAGENLGSVQWGGYEDPLYWTIGDKTGTNNFYLTGDGNYLMNQIGHLPDNAASSGESLLFANSVMYVSQRKQCEICAANQHGQQTSHFVRRISAANFDTVLTALQNGGNYWYPIDGCYQLTEDITLPEDWTPIKGFKGHWNSDVYEVTLNSKGTPLLANDSADGLSGWNLGTDQSKGTVNVFDKDMYRSTGVARVLGDLNDLFGTDTNYAGYTVKILGSDNPRYMSAGEEYTCTVNTDSKYVISNLPCVFDSQTREGVLRARVYDTNGKEVTKYGVIRTNVNKDFWDNDMTTPLYLGNFSVEPVTDEETYEAAQAFFSATTTASEKPSFVRWEYREDKNSAWKTVPTSWDITTESEQRETLDGDYVLTVNLTLNNTNPAWDGYEFRAVFSSQNYGTWSSYDYYLNGAVANLTSGETHKQVAVPEQSGKLSVKVWPAYAEQNVDKTVTAGETTTFKSVGYALDGGTKITAEWQYSTTEFDPFNGGYVLAWHDIEGSSEFDYSVTKETPVNEIRWDVSSALAEVNPQANINKFSENAKFHTLSTTITLRRVDVAQSGTHFRVHYTATSAFGTKVDWYSDIADEQSHSWTTEDGTLGGTAVQPIKNYSNVMTVVPPELEIVTTPSANTEGAANIDTMTPDEYGQMLLIPNTSSNIANGTAVYEAILYYKPTTANDQVVPQWQYMKYNDRTPKTWVDANGNICQEAKNFGLSIKVTNTDLGDVATGKYAGYRAMKSVMYISKAPLSMYNPEDLTKYYFRCIGTLTYETTKDTYSISRVDKWGGLSMDYAISLQHNGVLNYGQKNIINGQTVTTLEGVTQVTNNRASSTWAYPNLEIKVPGGRHVNSAIVYFDSKVAHDSRDSIQIDRGAIEARGIIVSEYVPGQKLVLVSKTKNTVELNTWKEVLRNYVTFVTYDKADFTADKVVNDTTGGAKIHWVVDELRLAGVTVDPDTGHAYKVVNANKVISWDEASSLARAYNPEIGTNGYLAEISNGTENTILYTLKGGDNGVRMWLGGKKTNNTWKWATSNTTMNYNAGISGDGIYLAMNSNGGWAGLHPSSTSSTNYTMYNIGHPGGYPYNAQTKYINLVAGHKYYVLAKYGDYGDSNAGGHIRFPALGIDAYNNWSANYNGWISGVDGIYTSSQTGSCPWSTSVDVVGTDITGNGTRLYYFNVFDLTATFGAGNEPSVAQCRQWFYGGSNPDANGSYVPSKTVQYTSQVITDVRYYAVEYNIPSLAFAVTDHSAEDTTYIGTDAEYIVEGDKVVTVSIKGNTKIYDGNPIAPSDFIVTSNTPGGDASLFEITYTTDSATAGYSTRKVNGTNWSETNAENAAKYHAVVTLTQEAIDAGWLLDTESSQTECDLVIYQRPINVYSYNNAKVYDGSSAGVIKNIQMENADSVSGVVAGDTVKLTTTTVMGSYVDNNGKLTAHNSVTNNNGNEYNMTRNTKISPLGILHNDTSDPHYNYVLGTETYTGPINQKGLYVHSLYLEDENNPRNVKTYDGNNTATIKDILIDGIVDGDKIGLKEPTLSGTYATANAGEKLDSNGQALPGRFTKLDENVITATKSPELTGNDFGDYFIEREEYSGAICRALIEVIVSNHRYMYGSETPGYPTYDDVYRPNTPSESWMKVDGLQGNDTLDLDEDFTLSAKDKNGTPIEFTDRTPVGVYPVIPEGLTENNYPVLGNYLVSITNGRVEVYPREIVITAADTDWYVKDEGIPQTHAIFEMLNNDGETYKGIGNDADNEYADMKLVGEDTIANTILVSGVAPTKDAEPSAKEFGTGETRKTVFQNGSNISYTTPWYVGAPAIYLDIESDTTLYPCEWCENYHGFELGTDHWRIGGYKLSINQDPANGNTLDVVEVENPLGEMVKNYTIRYVDGLLRVHPELRFQLKATVPLEVCMYGYAGDGEVVEPENYGITNYSNGAIQITDIEVKDDGWNIVDKAPTELLRGEMTMKMNDTQLVVGHNKPRNPDQWVIKADESEDDSGVQMLIPMTCYIAGGNVNERQETYVTHVTYTIAEYGITVPEIDGVELPDFIHGEPVTVDKNS